MSEKLPTWHQVSKDIDAQIEAQDKVLRDPDSSDVELRAAQQTRLALEKLKTLPDRLDGERQAENQKTAPRRGGY
jgi:hypothetical protein